MTASARLANLSSPIALDMDGSPHARHRKGVLLMLVCTLLWSMAGVVSRQLEQAGSFEVTFWRSAVTAVCLWVFLWRTRGIQGLVALRRVHGTVWLSGLCWAVMFTTFMLAMMLTKVANVLVTIAVTPLITALISRFALHHRLPTRTWVAILVAVAGITWMFGAEAQVADRRSLIGMAVAALLPLAAALNWVLLRQGQRPRTGAAEGETGQDMLPAVFIGACLSALAMLPFALPGQASPTDLAWLVLLGVLQLALPCVLVVKVASYLPAPEIALLGLLEVIFGVLWAWMGAGEVPGPTALLGGGLVIGALLANEGLAWRATRSAAGA